MLLFPLALVIAQASTPLGHVRRLTLNEFCAINDSTLLDSDGDPSDWIEIHNVSGQSLNLAGWALTDNPALPAKWVFPPRILAPGAYLIVFASDKNRTGAELHTNFKLDGNGEYLALMRPGGQREHAYAPSYPPQLTDVSYGLALGLTGGLVSSGQTVEGHFVRPTPGARNGEAGLPVAPVDFSVPRGFQDMPFSLSLSCATPGTTIWYTLDGSAPSPASGTPYGGPIPIATTTVVRAVALLPVGNSLTRPVAHTYIFAQHVLQQSHAGALAAGYPGAWIEQDGTNWTAGDGGTHPGAWYGLDTAVTGLYTTAELVASLRALPSISLSLPRDDWFAYDPGSSRFGIYPNTEREGPAWERTGSMEFIDPAGGPEVQANCVMEIQGGSSTNDTNRSQLSIALKFRSDAGPPELDFPMFPGSPVEQFDYLLLDGGNQGSIHANVNIAQKRHAQGARDQYLMNLHRAMGRNSTRGRHVQVYLNGLYWGVYNLHERPDHDWAAEHHGGDAVQYDWVKEGGVREGNGNPASHPSAPGVWNIINDIELNGLDESDVYDGQPAYQALQDYLDLADYIDYLILNFWALNTDWPQRNWMATGRSRLSASFADFNPEVQFRFHSWDAEQTIGWEGITSVGDPFYDRTQLRTDYGGNVLWLYTELLENAEFSVLFGDRAQVHLGPGGALHVDPAYSAQGTPYDPAFPERNTPATVYWQTAQPLQQAMLMEYARWGNYFHTPGAVTPQDWELERERILEQFCSVRSSVLLAQLRNSGLYPDLDPPVLSQHGGPVPAGFDLTISYPSGTSGYYTLDGSDPRLPGGTLAPGALAYTGPIDISALTTVKTRGRDGAGAWTALVEARFPIDHDLVINEVLADNDSVFQDEFGEFEDVIELYNAGSVAVTLSGMFLTDDLANTDRWQIPPGIVLAPGATIVFFADDQEFQGPLHTNFSLSRFGEQVGLFHDELSDNFELDSLVFGPQEQDVALGSLPDGAPRRYSLFQPSPLGRNVPPQSAWRIFDARDPALNQVQLALGSVPRIGQTLAFSVSAAPASAAGIMNLGTGTLEQPLGSGFLLVTSNVGTFNFATNGLGTGSVNVPIPANTGLIGLSAYAQVWAGGTLSNGVALTLGP